MITDAILGFFLTVFQSLWGLIPEWDATPNELGIHLIKGEITKYDAWAPVSEFVIIMGLVVTIFLAIIGMKFVVKILDWIRG